VEAGLDGMLTHRAVVQGMGMAMRFVVAERAKDRWYLSIAPP